MKVERWRQVDELLDAALERDASERSDFLRQRVKATRNCAAKLNPCSLLT